MRSLLCLTAALLVCFSLTFAQDTAQHHSKAKTFHGCLSGAAGSFKLETTSGKTYELMGDDQELGELAGNEVKITGWEGSTSDASTGISGQHRLCDF
jgi:hypothetical protein